METSLQVVFVVIVAMLQITTTSYISGPGIIHGPPMHPLAVMAMPPPHLHLMHKHPIFVHPMPVMKPMFHPFHKPMMGFKPLKKYFKPIIVKKVFHPRPIYRQPPAPRPRPPRRPIHHRRPAPITPLPIPVFRHNILTGYRQPGRTNRIDLPTTRQFIRPSVAQTRLQPQVARGRPALNPTTPGRPAFNPMTPGRPAFNPMTPGRPAPRTLAPLPTIRWYDDDDVDDDDDDYYDYWEDRLDDLDDFKDGIERRFRKRNDNKYYNNFDDRFDDDKFGKYDFGKGVNFNWKRNNNRINANIQTQPGVRGRSLVGDDVTGFNGNNINNLGSNDRLTRTGQVQRKSGNINTMNNEKFGNFRRSSDVGMPSASDVADGRSKYFDNIADRRSKNFDNWEGRRSKNYENLDSRRGKYSDNMGFRGKYSDNRDNFIKYSDNRDNFRKYSDNGENFGGKDSDNRDNFRKYSDNRENFGGKNSDNREKFRKYSDNTGQYFDGRLDISRPEPYKISQRTKISS